MRGTMKTNPEKKGRFSAALRSGLRTFRFMLIFFFMTVMMLSGFLTCMIFLLGYIVRFAPISGLPITTLIFTPVYYSVIDNFSGRFGKKKKAVPAPAVVEE